MHLHIFLDILLIDTLQLSASKSSFHLYFLRRNLLSCIIHYILCLHRYIFFPAFSLPFKRFSFSFFLFFYSSYLNTHSNTCAYVQQHICFILFFLFSFFFVFLSPSSCNVRASDGQTVISHLKGSASVESTAFELPARFSIKLTNNQLIFLRMQRQRRR